MSHTVRLEPVGVDFEVEDGETVLNAAFRHGIALPHGCKEGQCSACKCVLLDGEVVKSCLMLAVQVNGRAITTIEGLSQGDELHPRVYRSGYDGSAAA